MEVFQKSFISTAIMMTYSQMHHEILCEFQIEFQLIITIKTVELTKKQSKC